MKNFINISDIKKSELRKIIDHAKVQKKKRSNLKKSAPDPGASLKDKTGVQNIINKSSSPLREFKLSFFTKES